MGDYSPRSIFVAIVAYQNESALVEHPKIFLAESWFAVPRELCMQEKRKVKWSGMTPRVPKKWCTEGVCICSVAAWSSVALESENGICVRSGPRKSLITKTQRFCCVPVLNENPHSVVVEENCNQALPAASGKSVWNTLFFQKFKMKLRQIGKYLTVSTVEDAKEQIYLKNFL